MTTPRIIRPNSGHIILPRHFVDVEMPKGRLGVSGRYMLIKRTEHGEEIERTPWFDNLILDSGLNRWGTGTIILGAAIGTGTSAPAVGQVGLETQVTYTTVTGVGHSSVSALGASPYNNSRFFVYRTALGALNGNYSEVGVGWASGNNMFSRALILNGGGSPTTISVTSAQQLDIVYQLSVYPPLADIGPTSIDISGVSYTVTGRAANVNAVVGGGGIWSVDSSVIQAGAVSGWGHAWAGGLGVITGGPSGSSYGSSAGLITADSYVNNSLQRTSGGFAHSLTEGNIAGGIKSTKFWWSSLATFQYEYSPTIPKDTTKTMSLFYNIGWARRP